MLKHIMISEDKYNKPLVEQYRPRNFDDRKNGK